MTDQSTTAAPMTITVGELHQFLRAFGKQFEQSFIHETVKLLELLEPTTVITRDK